VKQVAERVASLIAKRRKVRVDACVHFCGYRYGRSMVNPYERYSLDLAAGMPLEDVRRRFVDYLLRYRPTGLADAFGITLSQHQPLWRLPWRDPDRALGDPGWVDSPDAVVDVMSFFCAAGVPQRVLEREFAWHENAFRRMRDEGYQPDQHDHIRVREFRRGQESVFLVLDGNHRLSSLSALGVEQVEVRQAPGTRVLRSEVASWPLVRRGVVTREDALAVFDAYFTGVLTPPQLDVPAAIV
jgi:hypothetical protein